MLYMDGTIRILSMRHFDIHRFYKAIDSSGLTCREVDYRLLGAESDNEAEVIFSGPPELTEQNMVIFSAHY